MASYPRGVPRASLSGVVTQVTDGDTITVDGRNVRLQGIDAPERDQPYGSQASIALRSAVQGRRVCLEVREIDQYGRLVAVVYQDDRNINRWLVRQGHVWEYDRYSDDWMLSGLEWLAWSPTGVCGPVASLSRLGSGAMARTLPAAASPGLAPGTTEIAPISRPRSRRGLRRFPIRTRTGTGRPNRQW